MVMVTVMVLITVSCIYHRNRGTLCTPRLFPLSPLAVYKYPRSSCREDRQRRHHIERSGGCAIASILRVRTGRALGVFQRAATHLCVRAFKPIIQIIIT